MAKKRFPSMTFRVSNVEDALPFPEETFDIVICNDVLEHLKNPPKALVNIMRGLTKGGVLYINTPNLNFIRKKSSSMLIKKNIMCHYSRITIC
jgi:2-polyprenyl-3-methyl-5-hydroxy-6-metoxy-1,4-benzoquinol methylase